jgi:hypothetical protein
MRPSDMMRDDLTSQATAPASEARRQAVILLTQSGRCPELRFELRFSVAISKVAILLNWEEHFQI